MTKKPPFGAPGRNVVQMFAPVACWKCWNSLGIQEARTRNPAFVGVEVAHHQCWTRRNARLHSCELPRLRHPNRIADVLPELIAYFIV